MKQTKKIKRTKHLVYKNIYSYNYKINNY